MKTFRLERFEEPLLDIGSYARGGSQQRPARLTPAQVEQIRRTVTHTPEVMVKVTGGGGAGSSGGVKAHFSYISRRGELEIETDDGERLSGQGAELRLLNDWDLDLEQDRKRPDLFATHRRQAPKLVHKLIFSMPAGTPPNKVLSAVRDFAREEFGVKHRYAMVLHTDEPHPHVHVVVKAVSEEGVRLNIRKATLRGWRQEFARHLREQGVAANATERAVRGESRTPKADPIYRANLRGRSTHIRQRAMAVATEMATGRVELGPGKKRLLETRRDVDAGWRGVIEQLARQGQDRLAETATRFVERMEPPQTEKELLMNALVQRVRKMRTRKQELIR